MVRAFGSVAAVVAAALAIVIGVLAFNAGSNHTENARPPGGGGQAGSPFEIHAVAGLTPREPTELVTSPGGQPVEGPAPAAAPPASAPVHATFAGGGGGAVATAPAPRSCSPGLLGSLVSLVGSLLGGGGGGC